MLITERVDIKPLLGMDWLREYNWTIRHIEKWTTPTDHSEGDEKSAQFEKFFWTSRTINDTEVKIQLKPSHIPIKQKTRLIPFHIQNYFEKEINKQNKSGHLEKVQKVDEGCLLSPVIFTVKKDKSVKIALGSRKINDSRTKVRTHMPNMEDLINQISTEKTRAPNDPLWISEKDLEYAYGQIKPSEETSKYCSFAIKGRNMNRYYRLKKGFDGLSDTSTIFQEKIQKAELWNTCVARWFYSTNKRGTKINTNKNCSKHRNNFKKPDTGKAKKNSKFLSKKPFGWDLREPREQNRTRKREKLY